MGSKNALRVGVVAVATTLLVAAGCGGSEDETSGATEWASSVCSATTTWSDSVTAAVQSLQGGNLSEDSVKSAIDDVSEATKTLAEDLQDVGKPDTEDGQQAKDLLDQLGNDVEDGVQEIEDTVDDVSGASGVMAAVSQVSTTLASMSSEVGGIVDQLEQLDPGGELKQAFNDADECSSLNSGG
jgi:methyl-accepting chemotaxis protein